MRRNIRKSTIGKVGESTEVLFRGWANVVVQVCGYCGCLVIRLREVITETPRAGDPGDLGADGLSAADCGKVGTCGRECRRKLGCRFTIVRLAGCTDACETH